MDCPVEKSDFLSAHESAISHPLLTYPNPFEDQVIVEFDNRSLQKYLFQIFTQDGKLVKQLREDYVKPGKPELAFIWIICQTEPISW
jgi:hypothetical protein